jgi:hypothetical protein
LLLATAGFLLLARRSCEELVDVFRAFRKFQPLDRSPKPPELLRDSLGALLSSLVVV